MTDQSLKRADELLTELTELVETARTVPMSASCVLPREQLLDALDELRETLPPEIDEARRIVANRDALVHDAYSEANTAKQSAAAEAETILADATHRGEQFLHDAEVSAYEIVEAGRAEHGRLVSATGVHQAAARAAAELREGAERYDAELRAQTDAYRDAVGAEAERHDRQVRLAAEQYAAKLTEDADGYAERTLAELAQTLRAMADKAAGTADQGRAALARRRAHRAADSETDTDGERLRKAPEAAISA